ncbi:hypothetical protein B296_00015506, partial [Ensete ventricosum]
KGRVSDPTQAQAKSAPNWEGPYRIVKTIREGTYTLARLDDKQLPRTWHIPTLGNSTHDKISE